MRYANKFVTDTVQVFSNAVAERSLRDPIPGVSYAQLALNIKDCLKEIIDSKTIEDIMNLFRSLLNQFGVDIPNDHKDDILYIIKTHIKNFQAGQYVMWTLKWLMISKEQDYRLQDTDYDNIRDYTISQLELMDCCGDLNTVITRIINEFDNTLKSRNIKIAKLDDPEPVNPDFVIYGKTYAKLHDDLSSWIQNILI